MKEVNKKKQPNHSDSTVKMKDINLHFSPEISTYSNYLSAKDTYPNPLHLSLTPERKIII